MSEKNLKRTAGHPAQPKTRNQSENAQRALAEAETRKREIDDISNRSKSEIGGRGGLDPARYGDWEVKGIASDF